jgi:hypothetical protein
MWIMCLGNAGIVAGVPVLHTRVCISLHMLDP